MLVSCQQMREAEERLFATGAVDAETLMEKAALGCARILMRRCPRPGRAILFVGKGNNGGDALVVGRLLRAAGWEVEARCAGGPEDMTELEAKKFHEFESTGDGNPAAPTARLVLVDGLLGIGARGPLRGRIAELAAEMNALRASTHALSFAIDIPSGIDGDSGECYDGAVVADHTLTIARVKAGLVADAAINHVGRLDLVALDEIPVEEGVSEAWLMSAETMRSWLPPRRHDFHKGDAGRVGIIAGSPGMIGAAELAARGALRGGAGLVTLFAVESVFEMIATRVPAEIMVRPIDSSTDLDGMPFDALAIGPGIGAEPPGWLIERMTGDSRPVVIDADGLNALAADERHLDAMASNGGPRLLTPHPGEMQRLLAARGEDSPRDRSRAELAADFARRYGVTLLLKGARTVVARNGDAVAFNSSGNAGMASGGMGDVLTGLCAAMLAACGDTYRAACFGAWLAGRSADLLVDAGCRSEESLSAIDVAEGLGAAFDDLRSAASS